MQDDPEQTLRQRKQAATALRIEKTAVALVLEHGLESVTVEMICEACGVSQRTFFNYFGTKDGAILGSAVPEVDERSAREFIASDGGNLLADALRIVKLDAFDSADPGLRAARIQVISATPSLFRKQLERMSSVHAEVSEILYLRLRRTAGPNVSPEVTRQESTLAAHLLAGVFQFVADQRSRGAGSGGEAPVVDPAALLRSLLPRLIEEGARTEVSPRADRTDGTE